MYKDAGELMSGNTEHVDAVGQDNGSTSDWNLTDAEFDDDDYESDDSDDLGKELPEIYDGQDSDTYKILAIIDRESLDDVFGEDQTISGDETEEFSQAFVENMCTMVADRFGQEAAKRFMAQNNQIIIKNDEHHLPKTVSNAEKAMSQAEAELNEAAAAMSQTAQAPVQPRKGREEPLLFPAFDEKLLHVKVLFEYHLFSSRRRRASLLLIVCIVSMGLFGIGVMASYSSDVSTDAKSMTDYSKIGTLREIISHLDYTSCPPEIEDVYTPSLIMNGYAETGTEYLRKHVNVFYEGSNKSHWYQYQQMTMDMNTFLYTEQGEGRDVKVSDQMGFLIVQDEKAKLWWIDYNYAYHIEGTLSDAEIIAVAESVCKQEMSGEYYEKD